MLAERTRRWGIAVVLLVALLTLPALAGQASAQDPYGSTTTEAPPLTAEVICTASASAGRPGDSVTVTVSNVPAGQSVRILLGGVEVARADAPAGPGETVTVTATFTIPETPPREYLISAVGGTFTAECADGFTLVAGATIDRQPGGGSAGGSGGRGSGGGALPRTGIYVGLLIAIALVLLLVGRALLEGSRRRRRRAAASSQAELLTPGQFPR